MRRSDKRLRTAAWMALGAGLPMAAAAALVAVRGSVTNTDIALLIIATVIVVGASGRHSAAAVASVAAALSYDYFHTRPYHQLAIANRNDTLATLVVAGLALAVGQITAHASDAHVELVSIVGAAVLSQAVPQPARFLVDHRAVDITLTGLVFTTALTVTPTAFRKARASASRVSVALLTGAVALPALSWLASRLVGALALRRGVLAVGLAPAEVASVATSSLAGADTAIAAGMLVGSTLLSVATAGFALTLIAGGTTTIHPVRLLVNLAMIVALPLAAGIAIRTRVTLSDSQEATAERVSVSIVTLLVWLVASEVHLSHAYLGVAAAFAVFLGGSAVLGACLGIRAPRPVATAILLTTSMRDFAIAAGIAVAAFGASAAAPLGLYGVLVIAWGMTLATRGPARPSRPLRA